MILTIGQSITISNHYLLIIEIDFYTDFYYVISSRVWFIKNGTSSNFNDLVTIIGIIISELVDLGVIAYYRRLVSPFSFAL